MAIRVEKFDVMTQDGGAITDVGKRNLEGP